MQQDSLNFTVEIIILKKIANISQNSLVLYQIDFRVKIATLGSNLTLGAKPDKDTIMTYKNI